MIRANYESDAGKRKEIPPEELGTIPHVPFEEYSEKLKHCLLMKRENGILEARLHTERRQPAVGRSRPPGPSLLLRLGRPGPRQRGHHPGRHRQGLHQGHRPGRPKRETGNPPPSSPRSRKSPRGCTTTSTTTARTTSRARSSTSRCPPSAVWNGAAFHTDLVLFCDITLCTEDAWTTEMHFRVNMVPGDGIQIAWRELMGRKRYAYAELTGEIITARKALALGLVNEICPDVESCYKRAWEIAELIMRTGSRVTRRITTQQLRKPWKEDIANELRNSFAAEMYVTATEHSPHESQLLALGARRGRARPRSREEGQGHPSPRRRWPGGRRDQVDPAGLGSNRSRFSMTGM